MDTILDRRCPHSYESNLDGRFCRTACVCALFHTASFSDQMLMMIKQQSNKPRSQRHHWYRRHGRHRQRDRQHRRWLKLHQRSTFVHFTMAILRRSKHDPTTYDAQLRKHHLAQSPLQSLRRRRAQSPTRASVDLRHAIRLLSHRRTNLRRAPRHET